jgi:excisionase family DNA binding protein
MDTKTEMDADRPMTPAEAAEWLKLPALGYDVDTLLRWAREGKIESIHIGNRVAFLREQLVRFVRTGLPLESATRKLRRTA